MGALITLLLGVVLLLFWLDAEIDAQAEAQALKKRINDLFIRLNEVGKQ